MKLEKFIDNLLSVGFIQNEKPMATNWYSNYVNNKSVFVGIMNNEIDYLGHIVIELNIVDDNSDEYEEIEKSYLTTKGAWNAIKKLF